MYPAENTRACSRDFQPDEETGRTKVREGAKEIIGGMITAKTLKYTKTNKAMAFLTIEDLLGTVEVLVFPKDYETYRNVLEEDRKVFIRGRVSEEDDSASKLICEAVIPFDETNCELWIQFPDIAAFHDEEAHLYEMLMHSEGNDGVVIYCKAEKAIKRLPANRNIHVDKELLDSFTKYFGEERVKVVEKHIENKKQMR